MPPIAAWAVGAAVVGLVLVYSRKAYGAVDAPASVLTALGSAKYEESKAGGEAHLIFAEVGLQPGNPYSARAWVRAEQALGRVVYSTVSVLEELETSAAPLYSFPPDKVPAYMKKDGVFLRIPEA